MDNIQEELEYASFGLRLAASMIDSFLSFIFLSPLFLGISKIFGFSNDSHEKLLYQLTTGKGLESPEMQAMLPQLLYDATINLGLQGLIIGIVFIVFWKKNKGSTPGKRLLHIQIIDTKTGLSPSYTKSALRFLGYFVSTLPLCLGFLWIKYDKKNQGFHDKIAGTYVVRIPRRLS